MRRTRGSGIRTFPPIERPRDLSGMSCTGITLGKGGVSATVEERRTPRTKLRPPRPRAPFWGRDSDTLTFPSLALRTALRGPSLATVAGGEAAADAGDERCPDQFVSPGTDGRTLMTRGRCSGALFLNPAHAPTPTRLTDSHCLYPATGRTAFVKCDSIRDIRSGQS